MRILFYGINYAPEETGIGKYTGEMAEWLAARGHDIHVVTAYPYYPAWQVDPRYRANGYRREVRANVPVWRCPLYVPRRPSGSKRLAHLASFALSSAPIIAAHAAWRPDIVVAIEPPLMVAPMALACARLSGAKSWLHIQDFEVDAAFDLGILKAGKWRQVVEVGERSLMRGFDRVSTISERMVDRLTQKGIQPDRQVLFPNWVDTDAIFPTDDASPLRSELGLAKDSFVALYSGNLGEKQGIEVLIEASRHLQDDPRYHFVICGAGAAKERLERLAAGAINVTFLPLQPFERLNDLLNMADVHLLPQRADIADLVMPSKLTGMLASGRAVVATAQAGTQVARVVENAGLVVPVGDGHAIAEAIRRLATRPQERLKYQLQGRTYALQQWGRQAVLERFEADLLACCQGKSK